VAVVKGFFSETVQATTRQRSEVECGWVVVNTEKGRLLQLDTFTSKLRKNAGKKSQTMQLDRDAAKGLLDIIRGTFPGIE
jgi:hypothetical protein